MIRRGRYARAMSVDSALILVVMIDITAAVLLTGLPWWNGQAYERFGPFIKIENPWLTGLIAVAIALANAFAIYWLVALRFGPAS